MNVSNLARIGLCALSCAALGGVSSTVAQDASLSPNFGSRTLTAGFTPDPHTVDLMAGGDIDASRLGGQCAGKISRAPDYRVNYDAAPGVSLTIRVRSQSDTTLVINTPGGNWSCNDDAGSSTNPGLIFRTPASGQYDIWVGTFGDEPASAQLRITEME